MIAGTLYEMALGSRLQKSAMASSDIPTNLKVEIAENPGVPTVKISNGNQYFVWHNFQPLKKQHNLKSC